MEIKKEYYSAASIIGWLHMSLKSAKPIPKKKLTIEEIKQIEKILKSVNTIK